MVEDPPAAATYRTDFVRIATQLQTTDMTDKEATMLFKEAAMRLEHMLKEACSVGVTGLPNRTIRVSHPPTLGASVRTCASTASAYGVCACVCVCGGCSGCSLLA